MLNCIFCSMDISDRGVQHNLQRYKHLYIYFFNEQLTSVSLSPQCVWQNNYYVFYQFLFIILYITKYMYKLQNTYTHYLYVFNCLKQKTNFYLYARILKSLKDNGLTVD